MGRNSFSDSPVPGPDGILSLIPKSTCDLMDKSVVKLWFCSQITCHFSWIRWTKKNWLFSNEWTTGYVVIEAEQPEGTTQAMPMWFQTQVGIKNCFCQLPKEITYTQSSKTSVEKTNADGYTQNIHALSRSCTCKVHSCCPAVRRWNHSNGER